MPSAFVVKVRLYRMFINLPEKIALHGRRHVHMTAGGRPPSFKDGDRGVRV